MPDYFLIGHFFNQKKKYFHGGSLFILFMFFGTYF